MNAKKGTIFFISLYLLSFSILLIFRLLFFKNENLIFDESYYFPAIPFVDTNLEHPPFVKFLLSIVASVASDPLWSCRIIVMLFAAIVPVLLFLEFGISAVILCWINPVYLVTSSMMMLEPFVIVFALLGNLLFCKKRFIWAGIVFGLALLSKWLILPFMMAFILTNLKSRGLGKLLVLILATYILGFALLRSPNLLSSHIFMLKFHLSNVGVAWHSISFWRFVFQLGRWNLDHQHTIWLNPFLSVLMAIGILRFSKNRMLWIFSTGFYFIQFLLIPSDHLYPYYLYYLIPNLFLSREISSHN